MRNMKDSGVEWIGEIPETWHVNALKRIAQIQTGSTPSKKEGNNYYSDEGGIPWIKPENLNSMLPIVNTSEYLNDAGAKIGRVFKPHTTFVACIASVGKTGYSDVICSCNQQINGITFSDDIFWKYGYYVLTASAIEHIAKSNTSVQAILNSQQEGYIKLPIPSYDEQRSIASHLDEKCLVIEEAIARNQSIIEKMEEYKKSIITKAVTKGLNPNVEMKDSRVEWIGKIPKTWKTKRIKFVANIVRGGSPRPIEAYISDGDAFNWIKIGDSVKGDKYIRNIKQKIIAEGLNKTRFVKKDTLLLTNSMSFGEPYILAVDGCIHDGWLAFSDYKNIEKEYLYYYLCSSFCNSQFAITADGSVVQNLNIDKVKNAWICIPSIEEQKQIIAELDAQILNIDEAISRHSLVIDGLEDYKKSLIYNAVTGKIDCRK